MSDLVSDEDDLRKVASADIREYLLHMDGRPTRLPGFELRRMAARLFREVDAATQARQDANQSGDDDAWHA